MKRYVIGEKIRLLISCLVLLFLFPYVIWIFVNGADPVPKEDMETLVKVKVPDKEEADGVKEATWTEYLAGILAKYVPENYEKESMKALAVAVRTQLYRELETEPDKILTETWMTKDEIKEKYGDREFAAVYKKYTDAVEKTDDTVLLYNEKYAWTPFHQSSTGMTRSASEVLGTKEYPYIAAKECPLDKEADEEIRVFTFTCKEIQQLCRDFLIAAKDGGQAENGYSFEDFEIISYDEAGYVSQMRIGDTVCTGDRFRDAVGLPSSSFSFSQGKKEEEGEAPDEGEVRITTTGKGHGLGMSLWTAEKMAEEGKKFEEILMFFYSGTILKTDAPETVFF